MTVQAYAKPKSAMLPALQLVASWTAALQGAGDLGRAAEQLMGLLPLRDVQLVRVNPKTGEARRIHASAGSPARDTVMLGPDDQLQTGAVVKDGAPDHRMIVLGRTGDQYDLCLLRLFRSLSAVQTALLQELAAILAESWAGRQPGLITARMVEQVRRHAPRPVAGRAMAILDYTNPYGLSRAEFRVCAMIGQGLTAKRIARELRLSEATVRSHQRAIYAKTDLAGQMEVMYHLRAHPTAQALQDRVAGMAA